MTYLFSENDQARKNLKLVKYTPTTWQVSNNTAWSYVEGSRIYYTPQDINSTVMYEFYFAFSWEDAINNADFKLEAGTTLANITDYNTVTSNQPYHYSHGSHQHPGDAHINDLVILRYALDSWSGQKIIQLAFKDRLDRNNRARLHHTRHLGASAYDSFYNAFVMCYEI